MTKHLNTIITTIFLMTFGFLYGQAPGLKERAQKLITNLKNNNDYPIDGKDTLIDLNGDKFKDILIEFYALAGTGEKNGVKVYLYDNSRKKFVQCEQLSHLANPTFYRDKKIVVGYYLGNGGGGATKLKWNGLNLDTLQHIDIDVNFQNNKPTFKLVSYDYMTKKKVSRTFESMRLPKEYNYGDYEPIIKSTSR